MSNRTLLSHGIAWLICPLLFSQNYISSIGSTVTGHVFGEHADLVEINHSQVVSIQELYNGQNNVTSLLRIIPSSGQVNQHLCYASAGGFLDLKTVKIFYVGGTYLLVGHVAEPTQLYNRLMAVKVNASNGAVLWSFYYGGAELGQWSVSAKDACMDKSGYVWILADACTHASAPDHELLLLKLSSADGTIALARSYDLPSADLRPAEVKCNDNLQVVIAAYVDKPATRETHGLYLDLNANAQVERAKILHLSSGNSLLNVYKYVVDLAGKEIFHSLQVGQRNYLAGMLFLAKTDQDWNILAGRRISNNLFQLHSATLRYPKYMLSGTAITANKPNGFVNVCLDAGFNILESVNYFNFSHGGNVQEVNSILLQDGSAVTVAQPYAASGEMYTIKTDRQLRTMCNDQIFPLYEAKLHILAKDTALHERTRTLQRLKLKVENKTCAVQYREVCSPPVVTDCIKGIHANDLWGRGSRLNEKDPLAQWQRVQTEFAGAKIMAVDMRLDLAFESLSEFNRHWQQLKPGVYIVEASLQGGEVITFKHIVAE